MQFLLIAIGRTLGALLGYQAFVFLNAPRVALVTLDPAASRAGSKLMPRGKVAQPVPNSARAKL